jgi:anti-sigma regulatory factor (Ser/Thr protein kinase)
MQDPKPGKVFLSITSEPRNLGRIREEVGKVTGAAGFELQEQERIKLAVDEAITNVIRHCYHNAPGKEIEVTLSNEEDAVRIVIRDFGPKPDLSKLVSRPLDDVRPGGLGCYFIRQIMDEVNYDVTSHETGTELRLVKYKKSRTKGAI